MFRRRGLNRSLARAGRPGHGRHRLGPGRPARASDAGTPDTTVIRLTRPALSDLHHPQDVRPRVRRIEPAIDRVVGVKVAEVEAVAAGGQGDGGALAVAGVVGEVARAAGE